MKHVIFTMLIFAILFLGMASVDGEEFPRVNAVVKAVQKSGNSVVNISSERVDREDPYKNFRLRFFQSPFDDFFQSQPRARVSAVIGSGVIIDPEGYIITNEHVVHNTRKLLVAVPGIEKKYEGRVLSVLAEKDLALVKIEPEATALTAIEAGDSDTLMIGETAIALGNPFGYENTVTTGVVSATNRDVLMNGSVVFPGMIQTDAAINPGNSGGALMDINGRLIGINSAIRRDAEGLGFAIPVNEVMSSLKELLAPKNVTGLWLGLKTKNFSGGGVKVEAVEKGSPAEKSKIRAGDIIKKVNGREINSCFAFYKNIIAENKADSKVDLTINENDVTVIMEKYGEYLLSSRCGIKGEDLSDLMARRLRLSFTGVLITDVEKGSPADEIGMKIGDVVVKLGSKTVSSVEDMIGILREAEKDNLLRIDIIRESQRFKGRIAVR